MKLPDERHRAPFLGLPVFETLALLMLFVIIIYTAFGPLMRWVFR